MSKEFKLLLVKETLAELGYAHLAREIDVGDAVSEEANPTVSPIVIFFKDHLANGNYEGILNFLNQFMLKNSNADYKIEYVANTDEDSWQKYLQTETNDEFIVSISIMIYLLHRFKFLELIMEKSMNNDYPTNEVSLLNLLKDQLNLLINTIMSKKIPQSNYFEPDLVDHLNNQSEGDVLLPLALQSPIHVSHIDNMIFNKKVLMTPNINQIISCNILNCNHFDSKLIYFTRLRLVLLYHLIDAGDFTKINSNRSTSKFNSKETLSILGKSPSNYLDNLVENSANYINSKSLYYLPPRLSNNIQNFNSIKDLNDYYENSFPVKLKFNLTDHSDEAWFAKFSPSGNYLVTGSLDGTLIIYDVLNNFKTLAILDSNSVDHTNCWVKNSYKPTMDKKKGVIYCCWDHDENYLVSCCLDTIVRVWDIKDVLHSNHRTTRSSSNKLGKLNSAFTLGENIRAWSCEFLPKTNSNLNEKPHFIIGSPDKKLKAFTIDGDELFDFYSVQDDDFLNILSHPSSTSIAIAGGHGGAPTGSNATEDLSAPIHSSHSSRNLQNRRNSSYAGLPRSISTTSNINLESNALESQNNKDSSKNQFNRINDLTITPNGKLLITANNDRQIKFYTIPDLFDPNSNTTRLSAINLNGRLTSCSVSLSGRYLLVSIAPEELQVWDISQVSEPTISPPSPISLQNNNEHSSNEINLPRERKPPVLKTKLFGHTQDTYIVRSCFGYVNPVTKDEELVITGSDTGYVYFWKLATGELINRVKAHNGLCNSVDWNRNFYPLASGNDYGTYWCSVGDDKLVKIWGT
ncbi:WD40 repeat-like protein [Hyphopichia burtonii NRRL Y-1933]|uniref:WD40 repeat-like protein n=1 Tax=Hyphopichia burtonii NRRL Y-1933 TaxID=984485 RepID=A0A1E4RD40_9ASCO|nr:WD40 repeat-like protein [Hyphopichia burtonii NRRL Y-1933]ODV65178.1 WD40 repeat-like protein [Hyphopichia burtonii NRRL Y-1933]